ncbi:MAG: septal ring lytic transglycosylase RlpA family protein [Candidatus Binataceae bacterium]
MTISRASKLFALFGFIAAILAIGQLSGCATTEPAPEPPPSAPVALAPVAQPVTPRAAPPVRHEMASWYGSGFNGHLTSTGERYNENALTAASKTLPIGSRVKVTNPANGHSVVVRINDRGPHVRGRSLDLSKRAAEKLGIKKKGVTRVEVTPAAPAAAAPASTSESNI